MKRTKLTLFILILILISTYIALPQKISFNFNFFDKQIKKEINVPQIDFYFFGRHINPRFKLKKGLDIQGGMQVILQADMSKIAVENREDALTSAKEIISKRVDMYGINEPRIHSAKQGDQYRLIIELPGISDQKQALQLVGQTAKLEFKLQSSDLVEQATLSAAILNNFISTGLTGQHLNKASLQFDQQTGTPVVALEFNQEGRDKFATITKENQGEVLAIFIDDFPIAMPVINTPILDGRAIMTGDFTVEKAENLAIQLNAGALPIPIEVLEQRAIGASLGEMSVAQSVRAGLIGLGLVAIFMILYYGLQGVVASIVLAIYAILTIALYKVLGVTLTLPGIAGLLLSIGMAVDSNILIFERIKEELRVDKPFAKAVELGFGKAWDSIKDANLATIMTALVLINPLDFSFLNTSGLVRGFGITLLIGVGIGLFTGVVISRNLLRMTLPLFKKVYEKDKK
ncbi:MAG: protein translocase subunit SecD [Patescibacteria group bacterium]|nr:protein translocase subunit SecD [Patescibacteria group bacterium]